MALTQVNGGMLDSVAQQVGFRNRIINGAMMIDQRNAGASVTPTNGQYSVDRWMAGLTQASKFSLQKSSTAPTGFVNSLTATSLSAYSVLTGDIFYIRQGIEGLNCADLGWGSSNAQTVTLSFLVRSSLTGTFGGVLRNSAGDRAYPFSYTINSANTFEQKTITIVGDTTGTWLTTNGVGAWVVFGLGVGATYSGTAGAWAAGNYYSATGATSVVGTNGATFYITGVQLEKGSTATSFDYRPYGTELALCQRYFQIYNSPNNFSSWGAGRQTTTTGSRIFANYPTMRSSPTAAIGGGVSLDYPNGSTAIIAITAQFLSVSGGLLDVSHAAVGAVGYGVGLQMTSSGLANFFSLSSEL